MNNIEILENFIDKQKSNKGTFAPTDFEIKAVENLIQENKELKEKAKNTMGLIGANYIHKDKIRDKIKELEKEYEEYKDSPEWEIFDETKYAYELLQELLEEK